MDLLRHGACSPPSDSKLRVELLAEGRGQCRASDRASKSRSGGGANPISFGVLSDADVADCFACSNTAAAYLPAREQILRTAYWRVCHAFNTSLPGWLVLLPTRHLSAMSELSSAESAELGPLLVDVSAALAKVVACERTYVVQFGEAEGFSHLHFHIVPRMPDQAVEFTGPGVFSLLGLPEELRLPADGMDAVSEAIASVIREELESPVATGITAIDAERRSSHCDLSSTSDLGGLFQ